MRACGQPWAVSDRRRRQGLAALEEKAYSRRLHSLICTERPRLSAGLSALGCQVVPGEANYLLFFHADGSLAEKLREKGNSAAHMRQLPRPLSRMVPGGGAHERKNDAFLQALREVL